MVVGGSSVFPISMWTEIPYGRKHLSLFFIIFPYLYLSHVLTYILNVPYVC